MYSKVLSEENKKSTLIPWILAGIFFIISIVLAIIILFSSSSTAGKVTANTLVPVKESFEEKIGGAAKFQSHYDLLNSKYFSMNFDFFEAKSKKSPSKTLVILENFATYQQTSDYTCSCASIIMAAYYLDKKEISERECAEKADVGIPGKLNKHGTLGAFPSDVGSALREYGYKTSQTSDFTSYPEEYSKKLPFKDEITFKNWVIENIKNKKPIIVLSATFGGHYIVIIGYDDMGTEQTLDDILICADPFDTSDHRQDGYTIWSMERFYSLWQVPVALIYDSSLEEKQENVLQFIVVSKDN